MWRYGESSTQITGGVETSRYGGIHVGAFPRLSSYLTAELLCLPGRTFPSTSVTRLFAAASSSRFLFLSGRRAFSSRVFFRRAELLLQPFIRLRRRDRGLPTPTKKKRHYEKRGADLRDGRITKQALLRQVNDATDQCMHATFSDCRHSFFRTWSRCGVSGAWRRRQLIA